MQRSWFRLAALLAVLGSAPLAAQQSTGTVRGRVIDNVSLRPLVGVRVNVAGRSALTRADGEYLISSVPAGRDSLRAYYLGYAPIRQAITVNANQDVTVNLSMTAMAVTLTDLVATGYGEQRAGNITGAVTAVSAKEFNTGRVISPAELIASKAPGVQVVDNNEPGGGKTIRIRGATSVNASSDPLYIIDGMPVSSGAGGGLSAGRDPLNFLNGGDIENITVLRDASAAAIYGANAANGVVIITTKGRAGQEGRTGTVVEYNTSFSASSVTRLPSMLNAAQFRSAVTQYAPQSVGQLGTANTDWFSQVTQSGVGQDHNLSLSNASEGTFYRLSLGYLNQDGIIQGTTAERLSLGATYQQRLFDNRLDLRANLKGSRSVDLFTPGGVLANAAQMGPTQPILDGTAVTGYYDWPGNTLTSADNPAAILALANDRGITYRSVGNVQAGYDLPWLSGLKANMNLGYDLGRVQRSGFTPSVLHSQLKTGNGGSQFRNEPNALNTVLDAYLSYSVAPNALPGTIDATAGYSYGTSYAENIFFTANGLSSDVLTDNGITSARTTQNGLDVQESRLISFFGRLNYNLSDKYLLGFSIRRDGSSRFGPDNAWGTFPSASVGWRLSEEDFLKDRGFSDLKLRGSWAKTGNQAFANYQQFSTYRFGDAQSQIQFGSVFVPTIRPSAVDPNIKWEATTAYNLGLDFGIRSGTITGSIDWYTKNTEDLIFNVPVAAGTNLSNFVTTNIGSMKNTGVEFSINARMLEGKGGGLSWNSSFNVSHNANELTNIAGSVDEILVGGVAGGVGTTIQVLTPGKPINSFYTYEHVMEGGKPIYRDVDGNNTINEQDLYKDQNDDGLINVADRRAVRDPAPKWIMGFSNYLNRGKWDMNFTMRAFLGNHVYNNVASNLGTYAEVTRASPYNLHSSVLETEFVTPQYLSDYYVEDASFLRLDNISLGYTFEWRGRPLRLSGTVQNVLTVTGYSGVDPTAGLNGIDNNIYPRARTFTGGVSWRF